MLRIIVNVVGALVCAGYAVAAILLALRFAGKAAGWIGNALGAAWATGWLAMFLLWIIGLASKGSLLILVLGTLAATLPLLPGVIKPNKKPDKPWLMFVCVIAVLAGWAAGVVLFFAVR